MFGKKILGLGLLVLFNAAIAKNIAFEGNIYAHQAEAKLVDLVDEVAGAVAYTGDYELLEPSKAGLIVNPWNRMIGVGVNPQTKNNYIVINQDWFKNLSKDEQKFLIGRVFVKLEQQDALPRLIKPIPGINLDLLRLMIVALFCIVIMFLFWLINQTTLRSKSRWIKWTIVLFVALVFDSTLIKWGHQKIIDYLAIQHDFKINRLVLEKLPNKEAAINACECIDAAIKEGLKNGETIYKIHENTYAKFANELRK